MRSLTSVSARLIKLHKRLVHLTSAEPGKHRRDLIMSALDDFKAANKELAAIITGLDAAQSAAVDAATKAGIATGVEQVGAEFATEVQTYQALVATLRAKIPAITVSPVSFDVTSGTPFTGQMVATGGVGSGYTFTVDVLPAGLSMGSDGALSGTADAPATSPATVASVVTATDSAGVSGSVTVTFNVT